MYYSNKMQGFYVGDQLDKDVMPDDCVEVSADIEQGIRDLIMQTGSRVNVSNDGKSFSQVDT